jgi:hypothetical protein
MKKGLAGLVLNLAAGAAVAGDGSVPPEIYAAARDKAPDVIVVTVDQVVPPAGAPWRCEVRAHVAAIERGERYRVGQKVKLPVRCAPAGRAVEGPPSAVFQDAAALAASKRARIWLESGYPLLDQYDILPAN